MDEEEKKRLLQMLVFENRLQKQGFRIIAGVDEAGRGPLAGPVVATATILPQNLLIEKLNDSKKLSQKLRAKIFSFLTSHPEVHYATAVVEAEEIDQMNIRQATLLAMKKAIESLAIAINYLLIDGKDLPIVSIPMQGIIKGDSLSLSIAASSVIAKETRDQMMIDFDKKWPEYGFKDHKGYGTKKHLEAIFEHGPSPIHRKSFAPISTLTLRKT